jgi:hypothetical protein
MEMVTAEELASRYGFPNAKRLRGQLRKEWPGIYPRTRYDRWSYPVHSEEAQLMEAVARRLAGG